MEEKKRQNQNAKKGSKMLIDENDESDEESD